MQCLGWTGQDAHQVTVDKLISPLHFDPWGKGEVSLLVGGGPFKLLPSLPCLGIKIFQVCIFSM